MNSECSSENNTKLSATTPFFNMEEIVDLHTVVAKTPHESLPYTIHDHSSYSGPYHPRNICINDPTEQSSRWSSGSHDQSQYVTLKLDKPAVACKIIFGKFHRSHVCNLKEFKVYGGLSPDDMKELLHKGLTDDNKPEIFPIRYTYNDVIFPIQYIKITPLATFGANFNYSIWYVEIRGIKDDALMDKIYSTFNNYKEMETFRLCLKYFRQKNMMDVYSVLQKRVNMELEHPLVSHLHDAVVIQGDFKTAENILTKADNIQAFKSYVMNAKYSPLWQPITAFNDDGDAPSPRGGHQMCLDPDKERIYLFGGWDGKRELADFWCYYIRDNRWKLISSDTTLQGGPSARSCHSICFDPTRKSIYVLGKYIEAKPLSISSLADRPFYGYESDFYQYFIELDRWIKISENTLMDGGPALLCDHQTCIDPTTKTLYVIGGRVVTPDTMTPPYSAFYAFDMDECHWRVLKYDENHTSASSLNLLSPTRTPNWSPPESWNIHVGRRQSGNGVYVQPTSVPQVFRSRAGHSILMDHVHQRIYIFGGQRGKQFLTDLCYYDLREERLVEIAHDFQKLFGSEAGYTQRASMNVERQEIYVYSGYLQTKPSHVVRNCLWVYYIEKNEWEKVYENDTQDTVYWQQHKDIEPYPRYAYQFIYNPKTDSHFLFAGHPGDASKPERRLDDFWELKLTKPNSRQIVRRCLYLLRTRELRELCSKNKNCCHSTTEILKYLRDNISPIVNHDDMEEVSEFKSLCADICLSMNADEDAFFDDRTKLFQSLMTFFPNQLKEPQGNLIDAVKIA
ncbi:Muskelin N-terminus-domain-containing protein [Blakeslea trispora]|nr:Muskelin N-terminus-domain-containing protein [Blakeslea trispora]